jgi:signal transduction histidine kinase
VPTAERPAGHDQSVRMRITVTALGVVGTALVLATVILLALLHHSLVSSVDARARLRLEDVAEMVRHSAAPPALAGADDGTVAQVVADGRVVTQSPIIRTTAPIAAFLPPADGSVILRTVKNAPIGDDRESYRIAARRVDTPLGPVFVYAGASLESVDDGMEDVPLIVAGVILVLILLVGSTTWLLVGRTLEPVEAIRRQVTEISAAALDRRVPVPATNDEIGRLARTMNEMLDRLDTAARRQGSFVANASHELRSPLAAIRAQLEVALLRTEPVDWPAMARSWLGEQARLERLVDDLLLLARMDGAAAERGVTTVDLDELVLREARDLRSRGRVRVDVSAVGGGRVRGHTERLRQVVRNLFDNAERHATTTVGCALRQRGAVVELVVSDDGPGIAPADRHRIFERFVRLDEDRNRRGGGGAGLGLAIVLDIVSAHGGTVEAADVEPGARLVVRIPAADPAASGAIDEP